MKTDKWMLLGLYGLLNIIEQRIDLDIEIDLSNTEKQLQQVLNKIKNKKNIGKKVASQNQIDTWLFRGFEGIVKIFESRLKDPNKLTIHLMKKFSEQINKLISIMKSNHMENFEKCG